ncbi:MAG: 23S rRNA (adenine(2503)-C(2))-methyltransferase RlmN [Mycoplasmoidaceae bacterium]
MKQIYNFTFSQLQDFLIENNNKKYIAKQIFEWIYLKQVNSFKEMTNISNENIKFLEKNINFSLPNIIETKIDKKDETTKFLVKLDSEDIIETVLMKFYYGYSVCITTQVGCNMGCSFCASGLTKKLRNLEVSEMVSQIMIVNKWLFAKHKKLISRIVVMGIGEPFDNYDNLINFLTIISDQNGLNISQRHITVSTCGIIPKIKIWSEMKKQYNLAISFHASNDFIRSKLMPINKIYSIENLLNMMDYYHSLNNRRITIEYILLDNINDSDENALELVKIFRNRLVYINLIPYNNVVEMIMYKKSKRIKEFYEILKSHHLTVTIRQEKGSSINAACGQLRYLKLKES